MTPYNLPNRRTVLTAGSALAFALERSVAAFFLGSTAGLAVSLAGAIVAGVGSYRIAGSALSSHP